MKFSTIFFVVFVCALLYVESEALFGGGGSRNGHNSGLFSGGGDRGRHEHGQGRRNGHSSESESGSSEEDSDTDNSGNESSDNNSGSSMNGGSSGSSSGRSSSSSSSDSSDESENEHESGHEGSNHNLLAIDELEIKVDISLTDISHIFLLILQEMIALQGSLLTETIALKVYTNVDACLNVTIETSGVIEARLCLTGLLDFILDILEDAVALTSLVANVVSLILPAAVNAISALISGIDIITLLSLLVQANDCIPVQIMMFEIKVDLCVEEITHLLVDVLDLVIGNLLDNPLDILNVNVEIVLFSESGDMLGMEEVCQITPFVCQILGPLLEGVLGLVGNVVGGLTGGLLNGVAGGVLGSGLSGLGGNFLG